MELYKDCEYCLNYEYDQESESYFCDVEIDMDDYERMSTGSYKSCPYFRINNEYKIVQKQN